MTFNKRLTQLRNSKNLTKKELALKLNLAPSSISMYESGNRKPSFEVLEAIADFFNVDLDYLLGKTDYTTRVEYIPNPNLDDSEDISTKLEKMMQQLADQKEALMFRGEPMDDETKEAVWLAMQQAMKFAEMSMRKEANKKEE